MKFKVSTTRIGLVISLIIIASLAFYAIEAKDAEQGPFNTAAAMKQIATIEKACAELSMMLEGKPGQSMTAVAQPAVVQQAPLRSPRQIDRPLIGDQKLQALVAKAKSDVSDLEVQKITIVLLKSNRKGSFLADLRAQAIEWLEDHPDFRRNDYPLSPKQVAWAGFLCKVEGYGNPKKTRPDLYPEG